MSLTSTLGLAALWLVMSTHLNQLLSSQTDVFGSLLIQQTANASSELILAEDLLSLNVITNKVVEADNVRGAVILDADGKILSQSGDITESTMARLFPLVSSSEEDSVITVRDQGIYATPIRIQDVRAGYALISLDTTVVTDALSNAINWLAGATVMLVLTSIILSLLLSRNLVDPIKRLISGTLAIQSGNLDFRISHHRHDELGELIDSFNHMASELKGKSQLSDTFKRYMPDNVATTLLSDLSNPIIPSNYVNASVLFIDIVGFTAMSEKLAPTAVAKLLNDSYRLILKASSLYQGTVDKFIGDGAMIIFGAPDPDLDHSFNAICCAQLFLGLVEKHNEQLAKKNLPQIQFRLGLHCGELLAGTLGTQERMQYTVVGDTVNLASRLCHVGAPGRLTISQAVYDHAAEEGEMRIGTLDCEIIKVKGKRKEIATYVVESLKPPFDEKIQFQINQITAMSNFNNVDHPLTLDELKECLESSPVGVEPVESHRITLHAVAGALEEDDSPPPVKNKPTNNQGGKRESGIG